jgi:hypothetical protein
MKSGKDRVWSKSVCRTFSPVDVSITVVAVAETDNGGVDMGNEEPVGSDNLGFQLLSGFE